MSRRIISDLDTLLEIAIGYDPSLDTFYLQIIELAPVNEFTPIELTLNDKFLECRGTSYREIETTEEIARLLEDYYVFTPAMHDLLEEDRRRERHAQ